MTSYVAIIMLLKQNFLTNCCPGEADRKCPPEYQFELAKKNKLQKFNDKEKTLELQERK